MIQSSRWIFVYLDKSYLLSSLWVFAYISNHDLFHFKKDNKELFDPKVPYLSVLGTLMDLGNFLKLNVLLFMNLL